MGREGNSIEIKTNNENKFGLVSEIKFDIDVTASNQKENGISGGIKVMSMSLGAKKSGEHKDETVSRIQYNLKY